VLALLVSARDPTAAGAECPNERTIETLLEDIGKPVDFSFSEDFARERQIAQELTHAMSSEGIGVALEDINGDGRSDILALNTEACGTLGCSFQILINDGEKGWRLLPDGLLLSADLSVLKTKHHGYNDFGLYRHSSFGATLKEETIMILRFDGERYFGYCKREKAHNLKENVEIVSTSIYDERLQQWRLVDKR